MHLEFIGKPTIDYLVKYPSVHLTSPHPWDPTMLDAPSIALLQMEGSMDHQLDLQKDHNPKILSTRVLMASSDPDVIKIHLQSCLCLNFMTNLIMEFSHQWGADY